MLMPLTGEESQETSRFGCRVQFTCWKSFPAISELQEHRERGREFLVFCAFLLLKFTHPIEGARPDALCF